MPRCAAKQTDLDGNVGFGCKLRVSVVSFIISLFNRFAQTQGDISANAGPNSDSRYVLDLT